MSDFTLRVKKFMPNVLLQRKQFAVELLHPTMGTVPKETVRTHLARIYKVSDLNRVVVGGFSVAFGGGRSTGFGRIYDSVNAARKFEKNFRLARVGILPTKADAAQAAGKPLVSRRAKKDIKIRRKKVRGTARAKVSGGKK